MADQLPAMLLSQLSDFIAERMGFHFPRERWPDLERGIRSAAREFEFNDAASCVQWLISSPVTQSQIEMLASHLTIGETYFFREPQSFEMLEKHILPQLIRKRRTADQRLRIWSAGCCTGEEPYSIAILLKRILLELGDWQIVILATDINPRFLKRASEGIYGEWAFRGVPRCIQEQHFTKRQGGRFEIHPDIKRMVTFNYLNLAEDTYPSLLNNTNGMDMIFCRNVLMYFAANCAKQVIGKFHRSLSDGGWLIVSPSEASHTLSRRFATVNFPGVIFYKKDFQGVATGVPPTPQEQTKPDVQPTVAFSVVPIPEPDTLIAEPPQETIAPNTPEPKMDNPERSPYAVALALYEQGLYQEAAQKISEHLSQDPGASKAMALLARVYANQGKLAEAAQWCEKALAADKLTPGCYVLHAAVLQEQGATQEAVRSLQRALYLDQNLVLAHFALGNIARQQGKFKDAIKHFGNARVLLGAYSREQILPESEGMTAGRLMEIIQSTNDAQVSGTHS